MSITVTGGKVLKGRNVTHKDKKGKTVATYNTKGKKSYSNSKSSKKKSESSSSPKSFGTPKTSVASSIPSQNLLNPALTVQNAQVPPPIAPSQVAPSVPSPLGPNSISPADKPFFASPLGKAVSGFKEGVGITDDPLGRDLQTQDPATRLGFAAGAVSQIAAMGPEGIANFVNKMANFRYVGKTGSVTNTALAAGSKAEKFTIGKKAVNAVKGKTTIAANTKTGKLLGRTLTKAGFGAAAAIFLTKEAFDSKVFHDFQIAEAIDKVSFAKRRAREAGDEQLVAELDTFQDDISNPTSWENLVAFAPWIGANVGTKINIDAGRRAAAADKKLDEDRAIQEANGESNDEMWARINSERADEEREMIDYYNDQRKLMLQWEEEARVDSQEKTASFWASERAKQAKIEEQERERIAEFWDEYKKKAQKASLDSRPSNLKFGLL